MTIKIKYKEGNFEETLEVDYKIEMVLLTQKDIERDDLNVITFLGKQTRDLYELLKEMYE